MAETPETTPISDWIIPNQDKFEQVVDARLEKLKDDEKPKSRSRAAGSSDKEVKAETPVKS